MEKINGTFQLSASDLVRHLACSHSTALEVAASSGTLPLPKIYDPLLELLLERGARHERDYVAYLAATGLAATVIERGSTRLKQSRRWLPCATAWT